LALALAVLIEIKRAATPLGKIRTNRSKKTAAAEDPKYSKYVKN
tara:strand:+ start:2463 stop:2594 length:132 start_codon:yes stop_codon:yes gene_type:complete